MKRFWMTEDKDGNAISFHESLGTAGLRCGYMDKEFARHAPHSIVPLIEHTEALETLIREAIANVDSVTCKDLREAILAVKEEVES